MNRIDFNILPINVINRIPILPINIINRIHISTISREIHIYHNSCRFNIVKRYRNIKNYMRIQ